MSDQKNIICDACSRTHLQERFHLPSHNIDLCLECVDKIKDEKLSIPYMRKFIQVVRSAMEYSEVDGNAAEDDDSAFPPTNFLKSQNRR